MDFSRQRLLMAVDPVVSFVLTVVLAVAGLGYWSLVVGIVVGSWAGGLAALARSPYPIALRFDRVTLRQYFTFSWPLMAAVGAGILIGQLSVLFGVMTLGLSGAGAMGIAASYQAYVERIDQMITEAMYPAVCRIIERRDLMLEAFIKSNRLALMWGFPFGVGLTLFAADLIHFGIGEKWRFALVLFQVMGLVAAVDHIGFNWAAFYRAAGKTRPIAVVTTIALGAFVTTTLPLLFIWGLNGFAAGVAILAVASLSARWYYVTKFFPGFNVVRHAVRAIVPTVPAVLCILALRAFESDRSLAAVSLELAVYVIVTMLATLYFERSLLLEARSYLRRGSDPSPVAP